MSKLGILAGRGVLPRRLAEACRASGREVMIVAFNGQTDPATTEGFPHYWTRFGAAASVLDRLREAGVVELCMIGPVTRPSLGQLMPDWRTAKFLARIGFGALGDDALLQAVRSAFEEEGFRFIGVHDVMKDLLARPGLLSARAPSAEDERDIARGLEVARAIGAMDIGQAVVIRQGVVLAVEAVEGTDAVLQRCAGLVGIAGTGGVLVKARKPQQDLRIDMPTIGPRTTDLTAAAGLAGIAVEAAGALIVDPDELRRRADALGLFVTCVAA